MPLLFLKFSYTASYTAKYFANFKSGSGPCINTVILYMSLKPFILEYLKTLWNFFIRGVNLSLSCGHWEDKKKYSSTELHSNSAFQWSTCRTLFFILSTRRILFSEIIRSFWIRSENKSHCLYFCKMFPRIFWATIQNKTAVYFLF